MTMEIENAFHRKQYERFGFTVILNSASPAFVERISRIIGCVGHNELIDGDDSEHSWKEVALDPAVPLCDIVTGFDLSVIIGAEPIRVAQWLNIYEVGEYIDGHVDAGGEAQLLILIEAPPEGSGGDLWIESEERVVPLAVGDVLIFAAHRLRHGTSSIRSGRRISFNCRIWLR